MVSGLGATAAVHAPEAVHETRADGGAAQAAVNRLPNVGLALAELPFFDNYVGVVLERRRFTERLQSVGLSDILDEKA